MPPTFYNYAKDTVCVWSNERTLLSSSSPGNSLCQGDRAVKTNTRYLLLTENDPSFASFPFCFPPIKSLLVFCTCIHVYVYMYKYTVVPIKRARKVGQTVFFRKENRTNIRFYTSQNSFRFSVLRPSILISYVWIRTLKVSFLKEMGTLRLFFTINKKSNKLYRHRCKYCPVID